MIEKGLADFVVVKNYGATGSDQLPFEPIADWWSDTLSQAGVTGYMGTCLLAGGQLGKRLGTQQ